MPPIIKLEPFQSTHWSKCWDVFVNHACVGYIVYGDGQKTGGYYLFPTFLKHGEVSPVENIKVESLYQARDVLVELFKMRIKDARTKS